MMKLFSKIAYFFRFCWIQLMRRVLIILTYLLYNPKVVYQDKKAFQWRRVKEPTILTCNHLRGCDGAVISVLFYRSRIHSLAARRWYDKWYLKPLLVCGYSIPIGPASVSWLKESARALAGGDSVLIFPEGKAVPGGQAMKPFKPGFLMLNRLSGAPILPLYMEGCYNRPFLRRLKIAVGTPYYPEPFPEDGAMSHEYQERQCKILYQKTKELQTLLHSKCRGKKEKK